MYISYIVTICIYIYIYHMSDYIVIPGCEPGCEGREPQSETATPFRAWLEMIYKYIYI